MVNIRFAHDNTEQDVAVLHRRQLAAERSRKYRKLRKAKAEAEKVAKAEQRSASTSFQCMVADNQPTGTGGPMEAVQQPQAGINSQSEGNLIEQHDRADIGSRSEGLFMPGGLFMDQEQEDDIGSTSEEELIEGEEEDMDTLSQEEFTEQDENLLGETQGKEIPATLDYDGSPHDSIDTNSRDRSLEEQIQYAMQDEQHAAEKIIEQFLVGIGGCGAQGHRESYEAHVHAEGPSNHHSLGQIFPRDIPRTLDKTQAPGQKVAETISRPSATQLQALFDGCANDQFDGKRKRVCLHAERTEQQLSPIVSFDIDSLLGFVDSPAVARQGIRFFVAPLAFENVTGDLKVTLNRAESGQDRPRMIPTRLKEVAHFLWARLEGSDFMTMHIFFPHLSCDQGSLSQMTHHQLSRWYDLIFYPAVRRVVSSDRLQHFPASFRHALATCRAPRVEKRTTEGMGYMQSQLRMSYYLPPQCLKELWGHILAKVAEPGLKDFGDPELLVQSKGTKLRYKSSEASSDLINVIESHTGDLHNVLDFSHVCVDRLYVDVAKETSPPCHSTQIPGSGSQSPEPQTYLWRRCCLLEHLRELYDGEVPKSGQTVFSESMLRDAGGITISTPKSSRLRRGGILYGQMYHLSKGLFDAAKTFPFQNPQLRYLALDPRLREGMRTLNPWARQSYNVIEQTYEASKRRCDYALSDSQQRSFGVREEYRISWALQQRIVATLRSLDAEHQSVRLPGPLPCLWALRTPSFLGFMWHNINKFVTGFELVRNESTRPGTGPVTWEQTKVMDMFLSCLRVSFAGNDYSRLSALWWDRREFPATSDGLPNVCHGLGFSHTMEESGYCWMDRLVDWERMRFLPSVTDTILFGDGTLQKRYLRNGGHVKKFFDLGRCTDVALEYLDAYPDEDRVTDRMLSWLCHICLQQMRIDTLLTIRKYVAVEDPVALLDDQIQFSHAGLSPWLLCDISIPQGNRMRLKSPCQLADALFAFGDNALREYWDLKPFRILYQRIYSALGRFSAQRHLVNIFSHRIKRYLYAYHWILPYPNGRALVTKTRDEGIPQWVSISVDDHGGVPLEETNPNVWYRLQGRRPWRAGYPPSYPTYLQWSREEWRSWVDANVGKELPHGIWEVRNDKEAGCITQAPDPAGHIRRNPTRRTRQSAVQHVYHSASTRPDNSDDMDAAGDPYLKPQVEFDLLVSLGVETYMETRRVIIRRTPPIPCAPM